MIKSQKLLRFRGIETNGLTLKAASSAPTGRDYIVEIVTYIEIE